MGDGDDISGAAAAILRRFPGPVTLYPSRSKLIAFVFFFASLAFMLALGAWREAAEGHLGKAALSTVLGLILCPIVILTAARLNRNWAFMTLDADGFEMRSPINSRRYSWKDADRFVARRAAGGVPN